MHTYTGREGGGAKKSSGPVSREGVVVKGACGFRVCVWCAWGRGHHVAAQVSTVRVNAVPHRGLLGERCGGGGVPHAWAGQHKERPPLATPRTPIHHARHQGQRLNQARRHMHHRQRVNGELHSRSGVRYPSS